ncbi:hypothetical protein [Prevotella sp. MA2016]|uniref:hypothetical protein n=1 Tax=Prevotella sp. MA2016 TaxID=1408310 RepID=UPI0012DC59F3|nr:hypothetical protein [Prevotella sp. MA2016]
MKRLHLIYIIATMLGFVSCIEPPLHLPGQELAVDLQVAQTELELIWDHEVQLEHEWVYGWDLKDDSIWGGIAYPHPSSYEVYRYYKGDNPLAPHTDVDMFTIDTNRFRRYFQFGYYDMLFYSNIDSKDGTQVLVIKEEGDSVIATTTGTRGISRSIVEASRASSDNGDAPIGILNQPEIFYGAYSENVYISSDLKDYDYDPVENVYIKHIEAQLQPLVYIYLVQFILYNNDDHRIKGVNGNAAISSMAASTNINTGHTSSRPTLVYFNTRMKPDIMVDGQRCDVFGGKLTTFGLCDNEPYQRSGSDYRGNRASLNNIIYYDMVWNNGETVTYQADVTSQLQAQSHGGIITVKIDCSKLTPPEQSGDGGGSLFIPTIEDYDEVQWEIDI